MTDELLPLLDDYQVARLLGYRDAVTFRRHRKQLEAGGFPKRRPVVKRYSPTGIRAWIDGTRAETQQSESVEPDEGLKQKYQEMIAAAAVRAWQLWT